MNFDSFGCITSNQVSWIIRRLQNKSLDDYVDIPAIERNK